MIPFPLLEGLLSADLISTFYPPLVISFLLPLWLRIFSARPALPFQIEAFPSFPSLYGFSFEQQNHFDFSLPQRGKILKEPVIVSFHPLFFTFSEASVKSGFSFFSPEDDLFFPFPF